MLSLLKEMEIDERGVGVKEVGVAWIVSGQ